MSFHLPAHKQPAPEPVPAPICDDCWTDHGHFAVDQYQEHLDHVAGSACEFQNAYALSRSEFRSGFAAVQAVIDLGRFAVVVEVPAYCRFTDASLGVSYHIESQHSTREAADAAAEELAMQWGDDPGNDCAISVHPELPRPVAAPFSWVGDSDIPF
jgi:hypothetical protein